MGEIKKHLIAIVLPVLFLDFYDNGGYKPDPVSCSCQSSALILSFEGFGFVIQVGKSN